MNVNIKRLHPDAVIPQYAHEGDAGFDLVAVEDVIIEPGETALIPTGLSFEIPPGYELQLRPRSGITLRTKLRVQLGTVDSNYRGEIGVIVDNIFRETSLAYRNRTYYTDGSSVKNENSNDVNGTYIIRKGDRIAQGIIAPITQAHFVEVSELSETDRGEGGFGSSGVRLRKESRKLSDYHTETTIYLDEEDAD